MTTPRRRAVLNGLANLPVFTGEQRTQILRRGLVVAGPGTVIEPGIKVRGRATLTLGRGCFVNDDAYFDCEADVVVGDYSLLAVGVTVLTSEHELRGPESDLAYGPPVARPVTIGTQVWLGARAIVLPSSERDSRRRPVRIDLNPAPAMFDTGDQPASAAPARRAAMPHRAAAGVTPAVS